MPTRTRRNTQTVCLVSHQNKQNVPHCQKVLGLILVSSFLEWPWHALSLVCSCEMCPGTVASAQIPKTMHVRLIEEPLLSIYVNANGFLALLCSAIEWQTTRDNFYPPSPPPGDKPSAAYPKMRCPKRLYSAEVSASLLEDWRSEFFQSPSIHFLHCTESQQTSFLGGWILVLMSFLHPDIYKCQRWIKCTLNYQHLSLKAAVV